MLDPETLFVAATGLLGAAGLILGALPRRSWHKLAGARPRIVTDEDRSAPAPLALASSA